MAEVAAAKVSEEFSAVQKRSQFMREFNEATAGFSEPEIEAAVGIMEEARTSGGYVSPREAAIIARFGSVENALRYASQFAQLSGQPASQPQQAQQQGGIPVLPGQPPRPAPPVIPGYGVQPQHGQLPGQQAPGQVPNLEFAYRGVL
jgi:hypothetical protein